MLASASAVVSFAVAPIFAKKAWPACSGDCLIEALKARAGVTFKVLDQKRRGLVIRAPGRGFSAVPVQPKVSLLLQR